MPRTVSASETKSRFGALVDWVQENDDEVTVENRGTPAVVVISVAEYESVKSLREKARRDEALAQMRTLREKALARNRDLSPAEGDALAQRLSWGK